MPGLKIHASSTVRRADFEKFAKDLELFLEAFTPQLLANWMKKDKGNLSKKLNGLEAITRNDIRDFYGSVSSVLTKLRKGMEAYQIELEMSRVEAEEHKKNLWEEFHLMQATMEEHTLTLREQGAALQELSLALRELILGKKGPQDAPKPQNP
jgi:DNA polymerase III delta prime subunit